jgi:hypothetical protein
MNASDNWIVDGGDTNCGLPRRRSPKMLRCSCHRPVRRSSSLRRSVGVFLAEVLGRSQHKTHRDRTNAGVKRGTARRNVMRGLRYTPSGMT